MLKDTFGADKPIIGMIHLCALPGSPLHDAAGGMAKVIDDAARDIEALQDGGVDAVMFGNENDRPYLLEATPSVARRLRLCGRPALKPMIRVPFGVNYLWDPVATVSLAIASAAGFAREIFTGVYESDMGLWVPDAATALRLRADGGRARPQAAVQHQCRIRLAARQPQHRPAGAAMRFSRRWPTSSWCPGR